MREPRNVTGRWGTTLAVLLTDVGDASALWGARQWLVRRCMLTTAGNAHLRDRAPPIAITVDVVYGCPAGGSHCSAMTTERTPVHFNHDRLLQTFVDVLSVDSYWGHEDRVVAIIRPLLEAVGVVCTQDKIGNLIGRWPANGKDVRPIMLNAHMDTVQPTPEMRPVVKNDVVYSDGSSVLGADDKAGVAAIVEAVRAVHETGRDHGPIDLVFTVGEDVGHFGSDAFDPQDIGARVGVVLDLGRPVGEVVTQQAGICSLDATFTGRSAAAAVPATGISAIAMLARAVDNMKLGRVDELTVANVGVVSGGQARNIVPNEASLVGQVRSLDQEALERQIAAMRKAIEDAAAAFGGQVEIEQHGRFSATQFSADDPAIRLAETAIRAAGLEPRHTSTFGGSDAQDFNEKGIATALLGCGYRDMHTVEESMPREALRQLTQVAAQLILSA